MSKRYSRQLHYRVLIPKPYWSPPVVHTSLDVNTLVMQFQKTDGFRTYGAKPHIFLLPSKDMKQKQFSRSRTPYAFGFQSRELYVVDKIEQVSSVNVLNSISKHVLQEVAI